MLLTLFKFVLLTNVCRYLGNTKVNFCNFSNNLFFYLCNFVDYFNIIDINFLGILGIKCCFFFETKRAYTLLMFES